MAKADGQQILRLVIGQNNGEPVYCIDHSPVDLLDQVLQREGIALFDMAPAMRSGQRRADARVTHLSDGHWNPLGHQIAARGVFDELLRRGLLRRRDGGG